MDRVRNADTTLVDGNGMNFREEEDGMNWQELANDFVLDMRNKRIKYWVKHTH